MIRKKALYIAGNFLSKVTGIRGAGEDLADQLRLIDWHVVTASEIRGRVFRLIDLLWTSISQRNHYQIALIEVYSYFAFLWAELLSFNLHVLKKTTVLTLHGGKLPQFATQNPMRFRRLIKSTHAVTSPSKYLLNEFHALCPTIEYIPNGIDLHQYPFLLRIRPRPILIWLRAFHKIYQPTLAIDVLHRVIDFCPDSTLNLIGPDKGDGSYQQTLELINNLELEDRVTLTGAVPKADVGRYLSQADIFLNTTFYESFGVSTLEAAACGLCIVTTNVGELPYLWEDGVDALLVPPNDPAAMAAAVRRILTEPGLAARLSANARKKAEKYDWSVIIPQWEALFNKIQQS